MNALEALYWVRLLGVPTLVVGALLVGAGLFGIVRHRRGASR